MTDFNPIAYGETLRAARLLMAVLQPLTGTRSTGLLRVQRKPSEYATVRAGAYCYPIIGGEARYDLMFKTGVNPDTECGDWPVPVPTDDVDDEVDTVDIPILSVIGGQRFNVPAMTRFGFEITVEGIFHHGEVTPPTCVAGTTGGVDLTKLGALKDIVIAETLDGPVIGKALADSRVKQFPAAIITWVDDEPADGATSSPTSNKARVSSSGSLVKSEFDIAIITSRAQGESSRRVEGIVAMNAARALLTERHKVDGASVSNPRGLFVQRAYRESGRGEVYQKFFIYHLACSIQHAVSRFDDREFAELRLVTMDVVKPQSPAEENQGPMSVADLEVLVQSDYAIIVDDLTMIVDDTSTEI